MVKLTAGGIRLPRTRLIRARKGKWGQRGCTSDLEGCEKAVEQALKAAWPNHAAGVAVQKAGKIREGILGKKQNKTKAKRGGLHCPVRDHELAAIQARPLRFQPIAVSAFARASDIAASNAGDCNASAATFKDSTGSTEEV